MLVMVVSIAHCHTVWIRIFRICAISLRARLLGLEELRLLEEARHGGLLMRLRDAKAVSCILRACYRRSLTCRFTELLQEVLVYLFV